MSLLTVSGCGYFSDKPVEDADTYRSESLNGCELDVEELVQILERDVRNQINCLEDNLTNFTKYVKREDPNSVTNNELSSFVRRFFKGHSSVIIESMGLIFDVNRLFLRDEHNSISTENIGPLFRLLRVGNIKIAKIMNTLKVFEEKDLDLQTARLTLENDLGEFATSVTNIITEAGVGPDTQLNLHEFMKKVNERFSGAEFSEVAINALMALKKLYLGGERDILTRGELFILLKRLPELGSVAFSLVNSSEEGQGGLGQLYREFRRNVEILEEHVFSHRREEIIFREGEVEGLIDSFFTKDADKFKRMAKEVKEKILGGKGEEHYTYREIRNFTKLSMIFLEGLIFYEDYKDIVENSKSWNDSNWVFKRETFLGSFSDFKDYSTTSLNENIYFPQKIELIPFLASLIKEFEVGEDKKKLLNLAKLGKVSLVGGETMGISKLELLNLLNKSSSLAGIFFDFNYSTIETHSEQEKLGIYYNSLKTIKPLLAQQPFKHVVTVEEALELISEMLGDQQYLKYTETVEKVKEKVFGGYSTSISVADIQKIVGFGEDYFGRAYFYGLNYELYEKELESPRPVNYLRYKHHKDFKYFTKDQILEYRKGFLNIIKTFRFFRFKDGTQYLGNEIRRTKEGLLEIHMIQFLFNKIAEAYGNTGIDSGRIGLSLEELNNVLLTFKPVLEEKGLQSKYPETFARNVLLLSDLFQSRSDGDLRMDSIEATEYGTLALFAIQTADQLVEKMKVHCPLVTHTESNITGFELDCYRPKFLNVLLNELNLGSKLPKLNQYVKSSSQSELLNFVIKVEGFARENHTPGIPETRKDLVLLIGAILNIESTFIRYDLNNSNVIEPRELERAYPVYEEALMLVADLDESQRGYAKSIFKYMIKNMKKPTPLQVASFHYNPFADKEISSKRLNIGALLYNMVMESAKVK